MKSVISVNVKQVNQLAKLASKALVGGEVFALVGPLGSGKTAFVKAVGKELKVRHKVTSPSFALLHSLPAKLKSNKKTVLIYHLDLYRTKNFKEVAGLGLAEFLGKKNTVTFIEWADKIKKHLPNKTIEIKFLSL